MAMAGTKGQSQFPKRTGKKPAGVGGPESGATGLRAFSGYVREEFLPELSGRRGLQITKEMRDNDNTVGGIMFAAEMLVRGVSFHVEAEDGTNHDDQMAADFVESCVSDMEHSWSDFIAQVVTMLTFGFDVHEIVYKMRKGRVDDPEDRGLNSEYDDGMVGWKKFAMRGQDTLQKWDFSPKTGEPLAMWQLLPAPDPANNAAGLMRRVPLAKCLHFTTIRIKGNPEGRSVLRNAYISYYYKKRIQEIEAVGAERDLTGIPVAYVPAVLFNKDATPDQKTALRAWKDSVRNTARNQQEGFVFPQAFDPKTGEPLYKFELLSTGGKRVFDTGAIIQRYSENIAQCVLADFLTLGAGGGGGHGSYAQSKGKTDFFFIACKAWLDVITDVFNRQAIPDLLEMNNLKGKCHLAHGDIARRDLTELSAYITSLVGAGLLTPDPVLEEHVREEGDLPAADQTTLNTVSQQGGGDGATPPGGKPKPTVGGAPDDEEDDPPTATAPGAKPKPGATKGPPSAAKRMAIRKRALRKRNLT